MALDTFLPFVRGPDWLRFLGPPLVVAGMVLHGAGTRALRAQGTPRGSTDTPRVLVETGPFRWTRNPMYLAGVLILSGVALVLGSASPWLVLPAYLLAVTPFISKEERILAGEFGGEYAAYRLRVRRWL